MIQREYIYILIAIGGHASVSRAWNDLGQYKCFYSIAGTLLILLLV